MLPSLYAQSVIKPAYRLRNSPLILLLSGYTIFYKRYAGTFVQSTTSLLVYIMQTMEPPCTPMKI